MTRRPELDGIRALACLAVLAHHLGLPAFGWGWLGVDAFFVLSGFLITSLLLAEHRAAGRIDLRRFWRRRARRLLPPLALMLAGSAVLAAMLGGLGVHLLGSALALSYASNWALVAWGAGATVVPSGAFMLLPHTWSLGVEEQFYLLWPLALVGLLRLGWTAPRMALLLALGCSLTLAWTAHLWMAGADAWGLLHRSDVHGLAPLLLGASLALRPVGRIPTLLGWGPLAWLGRRSYEIYLWHVPVLIGLREGVGVAEGLRLATATVALTLLCACGSFALTSRRWAVPRVGLLRVAGAG